MFGEIVGDHRAHRRVIVDSKEFLTTISLPLGAARP